MLDNILKPSVILMTLIIVAPVSAQVVHSYKLVPRTIIEKQPVKVTRYVDETVMEKQKVTSYKKVWQTETRQRYKTEYKPVRKTSEREERTVVRKPVTETKYRTRKTTNTTFEEVTEMRDEEYIVRKPVIETQMREERVTVRKPVTENLIEVKRTTSFRPVIKNETTYVQDNAVVALNTLPDTSQRPRMQWLAAGNYTDPVSGVTVYRRRGLHWVQPSVAIASTTPTLVPQETSRVTYVPETTETRKPVQVTRFVEQTETRKVPVDVQRTIERVETRKVPVTVRVPKTTVVEEEVPYTETVYKDQVIVKRVPYTETTFEKVETVEPYTVEVPKWIEQTEEVEVPRTVRKRVEYETMQDVPRTVLYKIPLDDCGNEIGPAILAEPAVENSLASEFSSAYGTTTSRQIEPEAKSDPTTTLKSVLKTEEEAGESKPEGYAGELKLAQPKTLEETSKKVEPGSNTELKPIPNAKGGTVEKATRPEVQPSETGNEKAGEKPPTPRDSEVEEPAENTGGDSNSDDDAETGDSKTSVRP